MSIEEQIKTLKKERQAIILAHNYTMAEVQDIADFVGERRPHIGAEGAAEESPEHQQAIAEYHAHNDVSYQAEKHGRQRRRRYGAATRRRSLSPFRQKRTFFSCRTEILARTFPPN